MWQPTNRQLVLLTGAIGSAIGAAAGYFAAVKVLEKKYAAISKSEIAEARDYFERTIKPRSPQELAADYVEETVEGADAVVLELHALTANYQSQDGTTFEVQEQPTESEAVVNVFEDTFDYEAEVATRTEDAPYIITVEEFMENGDGYAQESVTYYEGDDVLADERDTVVDNTDGVVGNTNLLRFGHGSKDNNIVYVRNDRLEVEYEIARDKGKYAEKVLGFIEPEPRSVRRARHDDG